MIDWIKGIPKKNIECCLVFYGGDFQFGCFDGGKWYVWIEDEDDYDYEYYPRNAWVDVGHDVEFYAYINKPNEIINSSEAQ